MKPQTNTHQLSLQKCHKPTPTSSASSEAASANFQAANWSRYRSHASSNRTSNWPTVLAALLPAHVRVFSIYVHTCVLLIIGPGYKAAPHLRHSTSSGQHCLLHTCAQVTLSTKIEPHLARTLSHTPAHTHTHTQTHKFTRSTHPHPHPHTHTTHTLPLTCRPQLHRTPVILHAPSKR